MAIRVAVDAMGGDDAPDVVVEGAVEVLRQDPADVEILLFGPASLLHQALERHAVAGTLPVTVVDAPDVIGMAEAPAAAVKGKPRSSIHLGLQAHQRGEADAFISAGNTGAVMAASLFILGRLPGVARPAIIGYYPTTRGVSLLLDVGTNVDCKPEHLLQFAKMGAVYVSRILKQPTPTVALMNIGEEPGKGNELVKAAYGLLHQADLRFMGNIEGGDILHHGADVVVCDGFVGNVMLKLGEGFATAFPEMVEAEMQRRGLDADARRLVHEVLNGARRRFNYEEYGGVPLLGVDGNVFIGHGGSTARAIARMIRVAADAARDDLLGAITTAMA